jgi:hypothetical protein
LRAQIPAFDFSFDRGAQQWRNGFTNTTAAWDSSGGNPAGHIFDPIGDKGFFDVVFRSPIYGSSQGADFRHFIGGLLSFDWRPLSPVTSGNVGLYVQMSAWLGNTDYGDSVSVVDQDWQRFSLPVLASSFNVIGMTPEQFADRWRTFADLNIYFSTDAGVNVGFAIDNVSLRTGSRADPPPPGEPGSSQGLPILPGGIAAGWSFNSAPNGAWVDPPSASGYSFATTDGSLFNYILDFPTGFADRFTVSVGETTVGDFGPGDEVDFLTLLGHGVPSFTISGINPSVDPQDPLAFPVRLGFDRAFAGFTMTPVPEPSTFAMTSLAGLLLAAYAWRKRPRQRAT